MYDYFQLIYIHLRPYRSESPSRYQELYFVNSMITTALQQGMPLACQTKHLFPVSVRIPTLGRVRDCVNFAFAGCI